MRPARLTPLAAVAIISAAPLLGGCGTSSHKSSATITEPVNRVVVESGSGDTVVIGTTASDVRVRWDARTRRAEPKFEKNVVDGVLTLSAKCDAKFLGACRVDQRVELPSHTEVEVRSGSGAVRVERAEAPVTVHNGSGTIELVRPGGVVHAQTGSGDITVDRATDDLTLGTSSGKIAAKDLTVRRLEATTGSGSVDATFREPPDDVVLESGSGDLELTVPKGAYAVDTHTSGGGSIEVKGLDKTTGSSRNIHATTASGTIKITGK